MVPSACPEASTLLSWLNARDRVGLSGDNERRSTTEVWAGNWRVCAGDVWLLTRRWAREVSAKRRNKIGNVESARILSLISSSPPESRTWQRAVRLEVLSSPASSLFRLLIPCSVELIDWCDRPGIAQYGFYTEITITIRISSKRNDTPVLHAEHQLVSCARIQIQPVMASSGSAKAVNDLHSSRASHINASACAAYDVINLTIAIQVNRLDLNCSVGTARLVDARACNSAVIADQLLNQLLSDRRCWLCQGGGPRSAKRPPTLARSRLLGRRRDYLGNEQVGNKDKKCFRF